MGCFFLLFRLFPLWLRKKELYLKRQKQKIKVDSMEKINCGKPSMRISMRMIELSIGTNKVLLTKNDVNSVRMLREGEYDGSYTNSVTNVRFEMMRDKQTVLATRFGEAHDDVVAISPSVFKRVMEFRDRNRVRLAFDKDLRTWR